MSWNRLAIHPSSSTMLFTEFLSSCFLIRLLKFVSGRMTFISGILWIISYKLFSPPPSLWGGSWTSFLGVTWRRGLPPNSIGLLQTCALMAAFPFFSALLIILLQSCMAASATLTAGILHLLGHLSSALLWCCQLSYVTTLHVLVDVCFLNRPYSCSSPHLASGTEKIWREH